MTKNKLAVQKDEKLVNMKIENCNCQIEKKEILNNSKTGKLVNWKTEKLENCKKKK